MSDVICTSKSRQLLGQPSFFYSNKKKVRGGERERERIQWKYVRESCPKWLYKYHYCIFYLLVWWYYTMI
jgi:hypothetical protein